MKKKSLVVVVLYLLGQRTLLAADTLHLNIHSTGSPIRLQLNANAPEREISTIELGAMWVLKIKNESNAKVVLVNLQPIALLTLEKKDSILDIKNGVVIGKDFKIGPGIRLRVENNNGVRLKSYDITITTVNRQGAVNNTRTANNQQSGEFSEHIPGSLVYDAIALADPKSSAGKKFEILTYYAAGKSIQDAVGNNPFLKALIVIGDSANLAQSSGGLSSILSTVGGLDVTKYADGLAKFLVKRAKQELNVAFFEKFKEILAEYKDIGTLFPKTATLLNAIDEEIYEYERYIQNLREAFKADIVVIHHNLPGIIDNHPDFFKRHLILQASLLSGCYVATELENQSHPGDILANYPMEYLDGLGLDFNGSIQTLQLLSASFRDTTQGDDANYWVPIKALRQLVNNKLSLKYYLGLVYHEAATKYDSVRFHQTNLVKLLDTVGSKYDTAVAIYTTYKRYVLRFAEKTDALNQMIKDYRRLPTDSVALEKYGKYLRSVVDLVEYCTQASNLPVIERSLPSLDTLFRKYFEIGYSTADLLGNISKKNYSAAINDVVKIYNLVRVQPIKDNNYPEDSVKSVVRAQSRLAKYGSFMSTVATAKTSDEVAKAIDAAALPLGSSRIKRETSFNVAINAYVGPYIGYEKIRGVDSSGKINAYGITAPIGFSVSRGRSILFIPSKKHRTSSSIFFSLIDLGAITAFRFTNDSTEKVPTIELKDIFSPGIFFSHGFGKTPISMNIGFQAGPLLRRVRGDENDYSKSYSRFSVSFLVDIPLFNLFSRSN
jgi:hypothetical protein